MFSSYLPVLDYGEPSTDSLAEKEVAAPDAKQPVEAFGSPISAAGASRDAEACETVSLQAGAELPTPCKSAAACVDIPGAAPVARPAFKPRAPSAGQRRAAAKDGESGKSGIGGSAAAAKPDARASQEAARRQAAAAAALAAKSARVTAVLKVVSWLSEHTAETPEQLRKLAKPLTATEYEDLTRERALAGFCGWGLCTRRIEKDPREGKMRISVSQGTVYRVEQKVFCGPDCALASRQLQLLLPTEPPFFMGAVARDVDPEGGVGAQPGPSVAAPAQPLRPAMAAALGSKGEVLMEGTIVERANPAPDPEAPAAPVPGVPGAIEGFVPRPPKHKKSVTWASSHQGPANSAAQPPAAAESAAAAASVAAAAAAAAAAANPMSPIAEATRAKYSGATPSELAERLQSSLTFERPERSSAADYQSRLVSALVKGISGGPGGSAAGAALSSAVGSGAVGGVGGGGGTAARTPSEGPFVLPQAKVPKLEKEEEAEAFVRGWVDVLAQAASAGEEAAAGHAPPPRALPSLALGVATGPSAAPATASGSEQQEGGAGGGARPAAQIRPTPRRTGTARPDVTSSGGLLRPPPLPVGLDNSVATFEFNVFGEGAFGTGEAPSGGDRAGANPPPSTMGGYSYGELSVVRKDEELPEPIQSEPSADPSRGADRGAAVGAGRSHRDHEEEEELSESDIEENDEEDEEGEMLQVRRQGRGGSDDEDEEGEEEDETDEDESGSSEDEEDWRTGQARTRKTAGNYTEVPKGANIFYEAPVIAAKVALSPFLSVWSALDSWLSAGARRVLSGGHQDSPDFVPDVTPAEAVGLQRRAPPLRGHDAQQVFMALSLLVSRTIPRVRRAMCLKAEEGAFCGKCQDTAGCELAFLHGVLDAALADLIRSFEFRSGLPGLSASQWAYVVALLLEALARARLPQLSADLATDACHRGFRDIVRASGFSAEEHAALRELLSRDPCGADAVVMVAG